MKRICCGVLAFAVLFAGVFMVGCGKNKPSATYTVSTQITNSNDAQNTYEFTFVFTVKNPTKDKISATVRGTVKQTWVLTKGWRPATPAKTVTLDPGAQETVTLVAVTTLASGVKVSKRYKMDFKWSAV